MTFEKTPRGTYGQNVPSFAKPLVKALNPLFLLHARRGGTMMQMIMVVLTTTGAKTGQRRQSALAALPEPDGSWLVVASAGGNSANPGWYHNLAAHPDQAELQIGKQKFAVHATQLTGDEREAAWERVVEKGPRYKGYATKTDRLIPIIRLTNAAASPSASA